MSRAEPEKIEAAVKARLKKLPKKLRVAFKELLDSEHLCLESLADVLDAADLADNLASNLASNNRHLLNFTIAYLHMRSKGVPIQNVIRMARAQKCRVRLDWNMDRWQKEHERLQCRETYARLAAANVTYPMKRFAELLPKWSVYLIRNSRSLGNEGLRQHLPVAAYHDSLAAGASAIVCVVIEGQRWLAQLYLTGDPEEPLVVTQIMTRGKGVTPKIRRAICKMLGIKKRKVDGTGGSPLGHFYLENLRRILPVLRGMQVREVEVRFDGENGSGAVDCVIFDGKIVDRTPEVVEVIGTRAQLAGETLLSRQEDVVIDLPTAISQLTFDYLVATGMEWCNGDGGLGELVIKVPKGTVSLEINTRRIELEHWETTDIMTGQNI